MKTCHSAAAVVSLVLVFLLTCLSSTAQAGSSGSHASFRPARVRAFAPETPSSLVVREGRSRFVRLTLTEACPALTTAQRLSFQIGPGLAEVQAEGALVPVVRNNAPTVVSTATPHAHIVAIQSNSRVACRLAGVAEADQAAFDTAAAVHGKHDNRHAGDGRPAG